MTFDFSEKGKVKFDMINYVKLMVNDAPDNLKVTRKFEMPAAENLFTKDKDSPKLNKKKKEEIHTMVAK